MIAVTTSTRDEIFGKRVRLRLFLPRRRVRELLREIKRDKKLHFMNWMLRSSSQLRSSIAGTASSSDPSTTTGAWAPQDEVDAGNPSRASSTGTTTRAGGTTSRRDAPSGSGRSTSAGAATLGSSASSTAEDLIFLPSFVEQGEIRVFRSLFADFLENKTSSSLSAALHEQMLAEQARVRNEDPVQRFAQQYVCATCMDSPLQLPQEVQQMSGAAGDTRNSGAAYETKRLAVLPCGHTFCEGCITQWTHNRPDCPSCRRSVPRALHTRRHGASTFHFRPRDLYNESCVPRYEAPRGQGQQAGLGRVVPLTFNIYTRDTEVGDDPRPRGYVELVQPNADPSGDTGGRIPFTPKVEIIEEGAASSADQASRGPAVVQHTGILKKKISPPHIEKASF
ncbi:unnamed protein product [Amoebophrya sp. A120]|nr:unnamed protein product [Amoebophrya sp. A120]|eukprot:GSA120T00013974001.1